MKTLEQKKKESAELEKMLETSGGVYIAKLDGISVKTINELRSEFRKSNIRFRVAKNTILKKVLNQAKVTVFDSYLKENSAIILPPKEDPVKAAKIIT